MAASFQRVMLEPSLLVGPAQAIPDAHRQVGHRGRVGEILAGDQHGLGLAQVLQRGHTRARVAQELEREVGQVAIALGEAEEEVVAAHEGAQRVVGLE